MLILVAGSILNGCKKNQKDLETFVGTYTNIDNMYYNIGIAAFENELTISDLDIAGAYTPDKIIAICATAVEIIIPPQILARPALYGGVGCGFCELYPEHVIKFNGSGFLNGNMLTFEITSYVMKQGEDDFTFLLAESLIFVKAE